MSTRERAFFLLEHLTESDLQMFLSLFGRLYPQATGSDEPQKNEAVQAFQELDRLIEDIPPFEIDEDAARDEYFKEKYGL